MKNIDNKEITRILIIKLRGIGDVVLSTIVIRNIKLRFPDARIDFLTEKPGKLALTGIEEINDILLLDRNSFIEKAKLVFHIRKNKYDLILDLFSNPTTAIITFLSGSGLRAGFPYRGRKYAYNLSGPSDREKYHSAELNLKMLEEIKIPVTSKELLFSLSAEEKAFAEEYFYKSGISGKRVIGILPSGGWNSKKCPPDKFAELASAVYNKYDAELLILWGPGDLNDAKEIRSALNVKTHFAPESSIKEMAALTALCDCVIANDSGPMHISAALGIPTLALFGPTNPALQGPYGIKNETAILNELGCIICNHTECPKNKECFRNMPVSLILDKLEKIIKKNNLMIAERNG